MSVEVHPQNVVKLFGDVRAVDDVTVDVQRGELFFLLGPSGCGKSTFLRIVAGFYRPDVGNLYFDDRLMNEIPPHKRNTGMVFQNYALWPHMTVYENVEYGLNVRKLPKDVKRKKVAEVLDIVHMAEYADRTANQLSGGQQQRVALARALVIEPDVLLLDEPLSNLDAKLRVEMRQEIKRIHTESGITTIYVTHDQKEALSLADRLAIMKDGKIVQVGTPREIYNMPVNQFVADFIGETNFINGRLIAKDNNLARVESIIGEIQSNSRYHNISVGDPITCSIRPESITIPSMPVPNTVNQFHAQISHLAYLGNVEEYRLLIEKQVEIQAVVHNPGGVERHLGDDIIVHFEPKDVVILPEDESIST